MHPLKKKPTNKKIQDVAKFHLILLQEQAVILKILLIFV